MFIFFVDNILLVDQFNQFSNKFQSNIYYRKKHLMIPLAVEFIVIVIDVRPPAVIMRKYRHAEQHDHRVTYFVLENQIDLPFGAFVQSDHAQHD